MKILVIDKYNYQRDLAQMDMYNVLSENYDVIFSNSENLLNFVTEDNYDYLYLGIYHPWCGDIDWDLIFSINKKPIIIDQVDNEGFIGRIDSKINYVGDSILLSRYLPNNMLERFWKGKLELLPWYINPDRFITQEKEIDIVFVCSINIANRIGNDRVKMSKDIAEYCNTNKLSYVIGEYYRDTYREIITKSKAMIIDGSRYCLTQKYIEAALSNCLIIGEKPISPPNDFIVTSLDDFDNNNDYRIIINKNRQYATETFANKDFFLNNFKNIIKKF